MLFLFVGKFNCRYLPSLWTSPLVLLLSYFSFFFSMFCAHLCMFYLPYQTLSSFRVRFPSDSSLMFPKTLHSACTRTTHMIEGRRGSCVTETREEMIRGMEWGKQDHFLASPMKSIYSKNNYRGLTESKMFVMFWMFVVPQNSYVETLPPRW